MARRRITVIQLDVDGGWRSLLSAVLTAAAIIGIAFWWVHR